MVPSGENANRHALAGILFLAACNEALQAYGTFNSSPQTTELFAAAREGTLMKWVRIGSLNALAFGSFGAWIARSVWPLVGTLVVIAEMEFLYRHAAKCGKHVKPPVENNGAWSLTGHDGDGASSYATWPRGI